MKDKKTLCVNACFFTFYFDPEHPAIIEGTEVKANCEVQRKQALNAYYILFILYIQCKFYISLNFTKCKICIN